MMGLNAFDRLAQVPGLALDIGHVPRKLRAGHDPPTTVGNSAQDVNIKGPSRIEGWGRVRASG
jgi:hypothetical protein